MNLSKTPKTFGDVKLRLQACMNNGRLRLALYVTSRELGGGQGQHPINYFDVR